MELQQQQTGLSIESRSFIDHDKEAIRHKAMSIVDFYSDGFNSAAEGLIFAKKLTELAEQIKENLADAAANELKLTKGEKRQLKNCEVTEQVVGSRYSYKDCGDPVWNELNEKIKEREKFLQSIKGSKEEYLPDTQEVVRITEPTKSGKLSLVIKIK